VLIVLAIHPDPSGADHLSAMVIDLEQAAVVERRLPREAPDFEARLENAIFELTLQGGTGQVDVRQPEELRRYFAGLVEELRPSLEKSGRWEPFGALSVRSEVEGVALSLDGRELGVAGVGLAELVELRPGTRILGAVSPEGARFEARVRVLRGNVAELSLPFRPAPDPAIRVSRAVGLYGGAGLALGGVVVLAAILFGPSAATEVVSCRVGASCAAPEARFATLCDVTSGRSSCLAAGGPLALPLGLSLLSAGSGLSLGSLLTEDEQLPWVGWVAGVAAAGLVYGLSAALNGGQNPLHR
jgi:hypothetical protein